VSVTFAPIAVEAEAPGNLITGDAEVRNCDTCYGGARVAYIIGTSAVTIPISITESGVRTITVSYESNGPRVLKTSADGTLIDQRTVMGAGWEDPQAFEFTCTLRAGTIAFTFYDDTGPAPDLDRVVIS
jgi:hypothetical protein